MTTIESIQLTIQGTPRLQDRFDIVDWVGETEIPHLVDLFRGEWWTRERLIVAPGLRDRGVGRLLLERILEHPTLAQVHHFELYCLPEMVPYYERWGFGSGLDVQLMRLDRRFS